MFKDLCSKDRVLLPTQRCAFLAGRGQALGGSKRTQPCVSLLLVESGWCLDASGGVAIGGRGTVKRSRVGPGQERSG